MSVVASSAGNSYFGRRYMFSASHRLHAESLSEAENQTAYGKCNNPHGHGHNYIVEVLVKGPVDRETGMVINLVDLDKLVNKKILTRFDHKNLNLDSAFTTPIPTTENLCKTLFDLLKNALPAGELECIRVEETENNFFECYGEPAA